MPLGKKRRRLWTTIKWNLHIFAPVVEHKIIRIQMKTEEPCYLPGDISIIKTRCNMDDDGLLDKCTRFDCVYCRSSLSEHADQFNLEIHFLHVKNLFASPWCLKHSWNM
ncbi:uncharacterized protein BYT42DRAFT_559532, partial [Radiomyces spectabilis]|uniref:uncharacterized protein n=1 Tax=Radiomyces spectabilis TaxID=64574 RepID=UPI00221FBA9A